MNIISYKPHPLLVDAALNVARTRLGISVSTFSREQSEKVMRVSTAHLDAAVAAAMKYLQTKAEMQRWDGVLRDCLTYSQLATSTNQEQRERAAAAVAAALGPAAEGATATPARKRGRAAAAVASPSAPRP